MMFLFGVAFLMVFSGCQRIKREVSSQRNRPDPAFFKPLRQKSETLGFGVQLRADARGKEELIAGTAMVVIDPAIPTDEVRDTTTTAAWKSVVKKTIMDKYHPRFSGEGRWLGPGPGNATWEWEALARIGPEVDLDIDGVPDDKEESEGKVIVRRHDGNKAPRKKIILQKVKPIEWTGNVILSRGNTKVKVYTAVTGGTEITFNGTDNKFSSTALPVTLWAQGYTASVVMRDVALDLKAEGTSTKDVVKFTVLWVVVSGKFAGKVSADNSARPTYVRIAGSDSLGVVNISRFAMYGIEMTGTVSPSDFAQAITLKRNMNKKRTYKNATKDTSGPKANIDADTSDTSPARFRDDNPQSGGSAGKVYDIDAPGLGKVYAPGTLRRRRTNFTQWAEFDGERCSNNFQWFERQSIKIGAPPVNYTRDQSADSATIKDNQGGSGTTPVTQTF